MTSVPVRSPQISQLFDGGGAEGVGRAQQHAALLGAETMGEFADGGGFARSVDANDQDHGGRFGDARHGALGGLQDFEEVLANEAFEFGGIADQFAVHALADALENFFGGAHADIGTDEGEFEFIEQIGIDLLGSLEHVFEAIDQTRTGLLHAAFQSLQKRWLLFHRAE